MERVGDVLHVFSHIRKTYRVQWVVLEGAGTTPPQLATQSVLGVAGAKPEVTGSASMWIRLPEVEKAK
jgi:hypothetical protein